MTSDNSNAGMNASHYLKTDEWGPPSPAPKLQADPLMLFPQRVRSVLPDQLSLSASPHFARTTAPPTRREDHQRLLRRALQRHARPFRRRPIPPRRELSRPQTWRRAAGQGVARAVFGLEAVSGRVHEGAPETVARERPVCRETDLGRELPPGTGHGEGPSTLRRSFELALT